MQQYKSVIFLTACINPNGMSHTVLQDVEIRKQQYVDALNFYLQNTTLPICFVENTGYDLSNEFSEYIDNGRLEHLTFVGNNYDKERGKGYGEAKIIQYGIKNSQMLQNCKYLIKVTGRVVVPDIQRLADSILLSFSNIFRSDIVLEDFIRTVLFITTPQIIGDILESRIEDITEQKGCLLEEIMMQEIIKRQYIRMIPFLSTVKIDGIFATENTPYINLPSIITLRDNLHYLSTIESARGFILRKALVKLLYYTTFLHRNR